VFQPPFTGWPNPTTATGASPSRFDSQQGTPQPVRPVVQHTDQQGMDESDHEQSESEEEPEVVSLLSEDKAQQFASLSRRLEIHNPGNHPHL